MEALRLSVNTGLEFIRHTKLFEIFIIFLLLYYLFKEYERHLILWSRKGQPWSRPKWSLFLDMSVYLSRTLSAFIIWCTTRVLVVYYYENKIRIVEQFFCIIFAYVSLFVWGFVCIYKLAQGRIRKRTGEDRRERVWMKQGRGRREKVEGSWWERDCKDTSLTGFYICGNRTETNRNTDQKYYG